MFVASIAVPLSGLVDRIRRTIIPSRRPLLAVLLLICSGPAAAHTIRPAVVTLDLATDGTYALSVRLSAELLLAGIDPRYSDTDEAPNAADYDALRAEDAAELTARFAAFAPQFLDAVRLEFDGVPGRLEYTGIEVPETVDLELARDSTVYLRGQVPDDAAELVWAWPDAYGSNVLRILRAGDTETAVSAWLQQGERSRSYDLTRPPASPDRLSVIGDYVVIGIEHIVPKGLDHILFVLGIFLLSTRLVPLLWQVTSFTVAHTITLGLSIYGIVALPASVVEPLIALSIVYVGIENALARRLTPWRVVLVFLFGLLHGLGFAGVLSEIGLPAGELLTALIAFNVGVELGQLAVIAIAFAVLGWWRNASWYRQRIVIPLSLLIAAVGLYWTWERIFGG